MMLPLLSLLLTLTLPALAAPVHSSLPIPRRSTLSHISCLAHPPFTPHWTIEQDPHKCLATCGSLSPDFSAVIRARSTYGSGVSPEQPHSTNGFDCLCAETALLEATPLRENDLPTCGLAGWVVYTPILPWEALNLLQKYEHRLASERGQKAYQALMHERLRKRPSLAACPDGFKVCPAADGKSFECVDVQTSLTSCGACVVGEAVQDGPSSKLGTDCTALPGVRDGNVQCKAGSCIAASCLKGFVLSDNRCVRV